MQQTQIPTHDAAIMVRLIKPDNADFSPKVARDILSFQFDSDDQARMRARSLNAQEGTLTPAEQADVEGYRRIGTMLGVLCSKARLFLKHAGMDAPHGHGD